MNADGSEARMLAQDGAQPSWSPDGQKIAFQKQTDIYVMNADGSGQRKLTRGGRRDSQPVWSPAQKK
jgi:TolB protein